MARPALGRVDVRASYVASRGRRTAASRSCRGQAFVERDAAWETLRAELQQRLGAQGAEAASISELVAVLAVRYGRSALVTD